MDLETQYFYLLDQRKRTLYKEYIKIHNLNFIRNYIKNGGNPATNPDISAEYFVLIDEYGNSIFNLEESTEQTEFELTKEETKF